MDLRFLHGGLGLVEQGLASVLRPIYVDRYIHMHRYIHEERERWIRDKKINTQTDR
jgi:hypothetical protein